MSSPLLTRSKLRKRPRSNRKITLRPFVIPVTAKVRKSPEVLSDSETVDAEALLDFSSDGSASTSPAKRHRGQPRQGSGSPAKLADPKLAAKHRSSSGSSKNGQPGPPRSASKGDGSLRHSGRGQDSGGIRPRSDASPQGGEGEADGQGDHPQTLRSEKPPHRLSKLLPRRELDFEVATDKSEAVLAPKKMPPHALRSGASPPVDRESPRLNRGNVTSFEPYIHSTPLVPSRRTPAGEASVPLSEDLSLSESGTPKNGRRPASGGKQAEPPVFGDLPTTRHAQRSLLEGLLHGGKKNPSPRASMKQPLPENRSSSGSRTERVVAKQKTCSFVLQNEFVECPVEEEEEEEAKEAQEEEEAALSAAILSSYKELVTSGLGKLGGSASSSLPKRGRPGESKSGAPGSGGRLPTPPGVHGLQDAAKWDRPSTSHGHRPGSEVATRSHDGAAKATTAQKKKKKKKSKVCLAIQLYQPKGVERVECQAIALDVSLTLAMEIIDEDIQQCQSEEGKRALEMYKQNIIKTVGEAIEELNVYTLRLPELDKKRLNIRALRKRNDKLEEKIARCARENGLDMDPYQLLLDEEDT